MKIMNLKIKDFAEVISGSTPKTNIDKYWNGEFCWITPAEINEDSKYIYDTERKISKSGIDSCSLKELKEGTVLLSSRAPIGKVALVGKPMYCNQGFKNLICNEAIVNPEYIYYWLSSQKEYLNSLGRGATFKEISKKIVEEIEVPIQSLDKQKKIVDILNKIQMLIEKRKAQIEALDELVKSRFIEMFGDPVSNPNGWNTAKLGDICAISRGGSPRPIDNFLGGTIPWIKIGDATKGDDIYLHKTKECIIEDGVKKSRLIKKGGLIFANCGVSLGFARILKIDGCIHDGWLAFEGFDEHLDKIFFLKSLNYCTEYFRRIAPDGTQPNLNTNIMREYVQILPPMEMQQEFAAFIEQVDKLKFEMEKSLKELENNFNSLMQKAFNGELFD